MTIEEALDELSQTTHDSNYRWKLLAWILREFMIAQGVDLNLEREEEE